MEEQLLAGGFVNTVLRVGDTVRRTAGAWTPTIQRLLAHAGSRGVTWVPKPLGIDERGREMLSFIAGDVPHAMPEWVWSEAVLRQVATALRDWHDATTDFDATDAIWSIPPSEPIEVICHNDFAPYNCVFRDATFVGAIDFDTCAPGPRLRDLAYAAYRFVPLMPPRDADVADGAQERSPFPLHEMHERLRLFLLAYAARAPSVAPEPSALLVAVVARLAEIALWTERHTETTGNPALVNHARMYRAHAAWLNREVESPSVSR